jgi:uncharacterized protein DUF3268
MGSKTKRAKKQRIAAIAICPAHGVVLVPEKTKYGTRYACPEAECTVRYWPNETSTPCDDETARLRKICHATFDPLWRFKRRFTHRGQAYAWMQEKMQCDIHKCHIGMFDANQCRLLIEHLRELLRTPARIAPAPTNASNPQ